MQLTINLNDLTTQTRLELFALLNLVTPVHPNQGTLPLTVTVEAPKPSKPRAKKPETAPEATEAPKEVTEPTPEVKMPSVSLQQLKELAQSKVASTDRETVKSTISKYADKLSEVPESEYENLLNDLNTLGD